MLDASENGRKNGRGGERGSGHRNARAGAGTGKTTNTLRDAQWGKKVGGVPFCIGFFDSSKILQRGPRGGVNSSGQRTSGFFCRLFQDGFSRSKKHFSRAFGGLSMGRHNRDWPGARSNN